MLTSSNQYLRPEYLTPLPTTLDAKKSPLALLAQTCSQIGADTPNSKLLQSGDKSKSSSSKSDQGGNKDKSSSGSVNGGEGSATNHKVSYYKPYESSLTREKSKSPEERSSSAGIRVRTPVTLKSNNSSVSNHSSGSGRCSSSLSVTTSPKVSPVHISDRKTPAEVSMRSDDSSTPTKSSDRTSPTGTPTAPKSTGNTPSVLTSTTDHTVKDLPLGTFKPGVALPPTTSAYLGGYPPLGLDLMASSLMSHHALKTGSLSPYLAYARMKAPGDPICRDPYCSGCSLSSHLLGGAVKPPTTNCPAGCTQCDHMITSKAQSYLGGHNPAAAAYAHAQLAALAAASHLPYVCNWISGDATYCGKRFSSSEELLSHLRTHTSVSSADGGGSASAGISSSAAALSMLSATAGLPPNHPLFHRTYPTPPLSPLATARYHPYSKPSLLPPSLSSYAALGPPGLPPYLSPYSLYGPPRLGSSMHP